MAESFAEYDDLLAACINDVKPRDFVEKMYAADIARLTHEIDHCRRIKAHIESLSHQNNLERPVTRALVDTALANDMQPTGDIAAESLKLRGDISWIERLSLCRRL